MARKAGARKAGKPRGARSASEPSTSRSGRRGPLLALVALAVGLAAAGGLLLRGGGPPPWDPPVPERLARVDPSVAALVREAVAEVEAAPRDADRVARLGRVYEANDLPEPARACFERAVRLDPRHARAWYFLGVARLAAGLRDAGIAALRRTTELAPGYGPAWRRLGLALLDAGDLAGARSALERAAAEGDEAAAVGLARVDQRAERHAEVVRRLEPLVRARPEDGEAHYLLGMSLRAVGRMEDAAVHLSIGERRGKALGRDPWREGRRALRRSAQAMIDDAEALSAAGHPEAAAAHLEQLVEREPDNVEALNNLAVLLLELGRLDEADARLAEALEADPEHFATALNRAAYHVRRAERDPSSVDVELGRALAYARRAAERAPQKSRPWLMQARVLALSDRWSEARDAAERALALEARAADPADVLGECEAQLGDMAAAARAWEIAVARDPASARLRANLAVAALRAGERARAEQAARAALRLDPDSGPARSVLAQLDAGSGGAK